ncbi:hypothetical protein CJ226_09190 [Microbacterium sp. UMB0228]|uniref:hypothetical protein n=1 Tax=Microbacterium sp. UMB0228 TaxID=2029109 RepID=UPI000C809F97|nr:hypothetical protein [Microbacterium sp. UMB0228]PMC04169.1 hypothetical protein CJ226_09190 [Microbacterium sp. UMB0228]
MATITFTLSDFGLASLAPLFPTVTFVPSGPGVADGRLFSSTPVEAMLAGDSGTVTLAPTDGVVPAVWYTVHITHLNAGGVPTHFDLLDLRILVPAEYVGPITGLPGVPISPTTVLVSLDPPPPGYKGFWLYSPATGQQMPLDDPRIGELRTVA